MRSRPHVGRLAVAAASLLEGEFVQAILRIETLAPGGTLELNATWNQRSNTGERVQPGAYTVRGELLTEGAPLVTAEVPLRIGGG